MKSTGLFLFLSVLLGFSACKERKLTFYALRVTVLPEGSGQVSPAVGKFEEGKQVVVTATAAPEYVFKEWQGSVTGASNPLTLTMSGDINLTAVFVKREYPLTVTIEGQGRVDEKVIQTGRTSTDYPSGTVVELSAIPSEGWLFSHWDADTASKQNPRIVTVNQPQEVKAIFVRKLYPLTVTLVGEGRVEEKVVKTARTSTDYPSGTVVELSAIPSEGWLFSHWDADTASKENPRIVTVSEPKNVKAVFVKRKYLLTVQIEGQGTVEEKIVKTGRTTTDYPSGTVVELTAQPAEGWFFRHWDTDTASKENPRIVTVNEPKNVKATFEMDVPVQLQIKGLDQPLIVSHQYPVHATLLYKSGKKVEVPADSLKITTQLGIGSIVFTKMSVLAVKRGNLVVRFTVGKLHKMVDLSVSEIEETTDFDESLKTPANGASIVVPVVVINYLPTADGIKLDMSRAPDDYWEIQHSTLLEAKNRIMGELKLTKFGIEEGTRFRQFSSSSRVKPYVGIKVIKYFNVYDIDLVNWTSTQKTINYQTLFAKLNMQEWVNNHGVKEVWITIFNKDAYPSVVNSPYNDPSTYYGMPESNMSSPLTGDISNSHRIPNDLPIYRNTYVVYGNSGHRGYDTNLHNRGHQIEAQLSHIERQFDIAITFAQLFYNKFVGLKPELWNKPLNRAGMTHFPPNTSVDYDYDNPRFEPSDILTWQPNGGTFIPVNNSLWKNSAYGATLTNTYYRNGVRTVNDYTNDPHSKWLVYWWQSIPGEGNSIMYNDKRLTNWWDVFYNWDDAFRAKRGLLVNSPSGRRASVNSPESEIKAPVCTHYPLPKK